MLSFCQRFIMKIQSDNIGHKTRLRNRFVNEGMENFEPHEVLEVMLYKSFPYSDTNALAHRLIDRFGSFAAVLEAPYTELERWRAWAEAAPLRSVCGESFSGITREAKG